MLFHKQNDHDRFNRSPFPSPCCGVLKMDSTEGISRSKRPFQKIHIQWQPRDSVCIHQFNCIVLPWLKEGWTRHPPPLGVSPWAEDGAFCLIISYNKQIITKENKFLVKECVTTCLSEKSIFACTVSVSSLFHVSKRVWIQIQLWEGKMATDVQSEKLQ